MPSHYPRYLDGPSSRAISVIAVALPLFILPMFLLVVSGAPMVVSLGSSTTERLEDNDGDGLAEFLVLDVDIEVFEPGAYGLHGSALDGAVTANAGPLDLPMGSSKVELRFSGSALSRSITGGPISFDLEVFPRDPSSNSAKGTYRTMEDYMPEQFEAPSSGTGVEVRILGMEVLIESKVLRLSINTTLPQITFTYSGGSGDSTRSTIRYLEVVAYEDKNGNAVFDQGTDLKKYEAPLNTVDWSLRTDFSQGYEISLHGVVPLRLSGSATAVAWAKMTFTYRSRSLLLEGWGQKFDIDLELWQPLDADRIAVVHELRDLSGEQTIEKGKGGSVQTDDPNVLRLISPRGLTTGIYSWSDEISVGEASPQTPSRANTTFTVDGHVASIIFSYPLSGGTLSIHHDPVIGMDPANMPKERNQMGFLSNKPLAMIIGSAIGVLIVAGTVVFRSWSERREQRALIDRERKGGD